MKKKMFSLVLVLVMVLGVTVPAFAGEQNRSERSQLWQDGTFNDGVYEGYYAQLNDTQKLLYDKIKEAFVKPVKKATIKFDEPILLKAEDGGSFTEDDKYQWMCDNMYNQHGGRYAVFRDHPELPWLLAVDYGAITLGEWIYDDAGVSIGYRMTGMYYENTYPWVPPEAYTNPSALEKGVDDAVAAIGEARPSRAATVRGIFEYLCKLTAYQSRTGTITDKNGNAHTVYYDQTSYSVLAAPHTGVCNAYSAAFKLLCDRYGIPCVHLSGATEAGNHAWNYVQMEDGRWYAIDPTWSDGPTIDYSYFLAGKNTFGVSHEVPAGNDGLACPSLSNTAYPYLEAELGDVPETIEPGESIQFSLSKIEDLNKTVISNVNVGLFVDNSKTASATGLIQNGSVSLCYNTAESNPGIGSHSFYIKCMDGMQKDSILAVVEITMKSTGSDAGNSATVTETKPDGTKVETVTETKPDGTKVETVTEISTDGSVKTTVKETGKNASGKNFTVVINAKDLVAGKTLKIMKLDPKSGEYVFCNAKDYNVSADGSVNLSVKTGGDFILVSEAEAEAASDAILKTVTVKNFSRNVAKGKSAKVEMSSGLNMKNVSKITYTVSDKSVATVNKNGKVMAKEFGTVTVKAKVTLKNGKTKTVKMTINVK